MAASCGNMRSRRTFLRLVAAGMAVAACGGGGSDRATTRTTTRAAKRNLRILQWSHTVPAYDAWFDNEYTQRWGHEHDVEVTVDHIPVGSIQDQAATEVTRQGGHDIFGFPLVPPAAFEDEVIDHREIVEEVRTKLGPPTPLVERSILDPKTGKYFGFPEYWAPFPVNYRSDLWRPTGLEPRSWDDILRAAPALKAAGHPLAFSFSRGDPDANWTLLSLMVAHGGSIQDEAGHVTINRSETVEAVRQGAGIYKAGMPDEVFTWEGVSNNRFLASGKGSMTLNPVSALRAVEKQDPGLAENFALAPVPSGPAGRLGSSSVIGVYVIWKFSPNAEAAKQFLVDLAVSYREAFLRSELFNVPAFPGAVTDLDKLLAEDPARPAGKYSLLSQAGDWSTNFGHPGSTNAAVDEVYNQFVVPDMFARVARGEMGPAESVAAAEAQIIPIFDKWRGLGKI